MLDAHSQRPCPRCGATQGTTSITWAASTTYWWEPCSCLDAAQATTQERQAAFRHQFARPLEHRGAGLVDLDPDGCLTLERFNGGLLRNKPAAHPLALATVWLERILAYGPRRRADDSDAPAQALYFYSPQPGCGKTHLALGLGHAAQAAGQRVGVIVERVFLQQMWGCALEHKPALLDQLAARPWLVLVDELGQREQTRESVRNEYFALIDLRYGSGGWTVFTSNLTPDELLQYGVLTPYAYSRLMAMIGNTVIAFAGDDQRGKKRLPDR